MLYEHALIVAGYEIAVPVWEYNDAVATFPVHDDDPEETKRI